MGQSSEAPLFSIPLSGGIEENRAWGLRGLASRLGCPMGQKEVAIVMAGVHMA